MNKKLNLIAIVGLCCFTINALAEKQFALTLCDKPDFECIKVPHSKSWLTLFPDPEQRDIVMRVNRMNTQIRNGMTIAIPKNLAAVTIYDVAPFPRYINNSGKKTIFVSQKELAWGAYDEKGELIWWGPISPGKGYCPDVPDGECATPSGEFSMIRKQGIDCISTVFPRRANGDDGGAPMPYCMHFFRGYALHGSPIVPGRPDSHGCVRLFPEDARWLNEEFIDLPGADAQGTKVIIEGS